MAVVMQQELQTYIVYDIPNDRVRYRIANACKDYGLERIQFSAFSGWLNANKREELFLRLRRELGDHPGKILVLPVCERDLKAMKEVVIVEEAQGADDAGAEISERP